jgi:hypothetical protein
MANPSIPGIPPSFWDDRRKRFADEIADMKAQLAPLEDGSQFLRQGGTDVTAHWIDHLRKTIKNYEEILEALKRGEVR